MVVPESRSVQEQTSAAVYFLSRNQWVTSSMTAIVRTLTREGFVLAADGRSSGAIDGAILTDSAQKIFPIKTPLGAFAYSIVGTVELITGDGTEVAVDIVDEIQASASLLTHRKTKTLTGYAVRLFRPVCKAMEDALESGRISGYPSREANSTVERGDTIVRVYVDGFQDGYPFSVGVRISIKMEIYVIRKYLRNSRTSEYTKP